MHFTNIVNATYNRVARLSSPMVLSIQVCIGLKVVKDWGLHPIIEHSTLEDIFKRSTLEDIFKRIPNGKLKGASCVLLPETPDDAEYKGH